MVLPSQFSPDRDNSDTLSPHRLKMEHVQSEMLITWREKTSFSPSLFGEKTFGISRSIGSSSTDTSSKKRYTPPEVDVSLSVRIIFVLSPKHPIVIYCSPPFALYNPDTCCHPSVSLIKLLAAFSI